jgi:hypothetical protein
MAQSKITWTRNHVSEFIISAVCYFIINQLFQDISLGPKHTGSKYSAVRGAAVTNVTIYATRLTDRFKFQVPNICCPSAKYSPLFTGLLAKRRHKFEHCQGISTN